MAGVQGTPTYNTAGSGGTTINHSITVTGADRDILVILYQEDTLTRTFTVSSNVDGSFGSAVGYINPTGAVGVWLLRNVTAGAHTITVTASVSGVSFGSICAVIEDLGTDTPVVDFITAGTNGTSHISGSTGVTTTANSFVVCVGVLTGSVTSKVAGSGYTEFAGPGAGNARFSQYQNFTSNLTNHQGPWTSTGTNRQNRGIIIAFPEDSGPPPGPSVFLSHLIE